MEKVVNMSVNVDDFVSDDTKKVDGRSLRGAMREENRPVDATVEAAERLRQRERELADKFNDLSSLEYHDDFAIDPNIVPDGWVYGWKVHTVVNMEETTAIRKLLADGWTYVPSSRHPEMMPVGHTGNIERGGLFLMEIPKSINDRMIQVREIMARQPIDGKYAQLSNEFSSSNGKTPISKTVGDAIPE